MFAAALSEMSSTRSSRDRGKQLQQQGKSRSAVEALRQQLKALEEMEDETQEEAEEKRQEAKEDSSNTTRERADDRERQQQLPSLASSSSSSSSSSSAPQPGRFSLELEDEASEAADESQDETKAGEERTGKKRKGKPSATPLPAITFLIEQRFAPQYRDQWKDSNPVSLTRHWDRLIDELKTRFNEDKTKEQIYNFLHNLQKRYTQRKKREAEIGAKAMPDWPYHELMEKYLKDSPDVMKPARRYRKQPATLPESSGEPERKSQAEPPGQRAAFSAASSSSASAAKPSASVAAAGAAAAAAQKQELAKLFLNHLEAERRELWQRSEVTQRLMWKALTQTQPRSYADVIAEIQAEMAVALDAASSGGKTQQRTG